MNIQLQNLKIKGEFFVFLFYFYLVASDRFEKYFQKTLPPEKIHFPPSTHPPPPSPPPPKNSKSASPPLLANIENFSASPLLQKWWGEDTMKFEIRRRKYSFSKKFHHGCLVCLVSL